MHDDKRREVLLGDLDALAPTAGEPPLSATERVATAKARPAAPARTPVNPLLVLFVVLLLGVIAYLFHTQQKLSASLAAMEVSAQASVESLASQVLSTNDTLQDTDGAMRKALRDLGRELQRLEGTVAGQGKQQAEAAKKQAAADAGIRTLAEELQRADKARQQADTQQEARLKSLADAQDAQVAKQKTLADSLARLERNNDVAALRTELNLLAAELRELREEHDRRLKAGEQAVLSNDAFRRQVNQTLERINQQLAELSRR